MKRIIQSFFIALLSLITFKSNAMILALDKEIKQRMSSPELPNNVIYYQEEPVMHSVTPSLTDGQLVLEAAKKNDLAQVIKYIDKPLNIACPQGNSPLMYAIMHNNKEMVHVLVEAGALLGKCNRHGETAIMMAVREDDPELLELLLHQDVSSIINCVTIQPDQSEQADYETALSMAARRGNPKIISLLLENGANPEQTTGHGLTPLQIALMWKRNEAIELLKGNHDLYAVKLITATMNGDRREVESLLDGIKSSTTEYLNPALAQVVHDYAMSLNYSYQGATALHWAVCLPHPMAPSLTTALLKAGANPNIYNKHNELPLSYAIANRNVACVKALMQAGSPYVCACGENLVEKAAELYMQNSSDERTHEVVTTMITYGAKFDMDLVDKNVMPVQPQTNAHESKVNLPDHVQEPLIDSLTQAILDRNEPMVDRLLSNGADPSLVKHQGYTPLMYATAIKHHDIMRKVAVDSDPDVQSDQEKITALDIALANKDPEAVLILIQAGSNVDIQDARGETAVHKAARMNDHQTYDLIKSASRGLKVFDHIDAHDEQEVGCLIEEGAFLNYVKNNQTPLMVAAQKGLTDMVDLLIDQDTVDVNFRNTSGQTALSLARGKQIKQRLKEAGAKA